MGKQPQEISPAAWTYTYATIAVVNAIKQSVATATAQNVYTGVALDGSADSGARSAASLPFEQAITVTTASHSGSYKTGAGNAITIVGQTQAQLDAGQGATTTISLALTQANGNEVVSSTVGLVNVSSITVPAQNDTSGSFQFGIGDILLANPCRAVRAGLAAGGNLKVKYQNGVTDTPPLLQGERLDANPARIFDSGTTALPITVSG